MKLVRLYVTFTVVMQESGAQTLFYRDTPIATCNAVGKWLISAELSQHVRKRVNQYLMRVAQENRCYVKQADLQYTVERL